MRDLLFGAFVLVIVCSNFYPAEAAGLSTAFSEVTLDNLEIGRNYSTKQAANLPLEVLNTGKKPIDLKVEAVMPQGSELERGFEPIPDITWIKFEKSEFKDLKPGTSALSNVFISIPNKKEYKGKKYQVFIWSHSIGGFIGIGLKSKLFLNIQKG